MRKFILGTMLIVTGAAWCQQATPASSSSSEITEIKNALANVSASLDSLYATNMNWFTPCRASAYSDYVSYLAYEGKYNSSSHFMRMSSNHAQTFGPSVQTLGASDTTSRDGIGLSWIDPYLTVGNDIRELLYKARNFSAFQRLALEISEQHKTTHEIYQLRLAALRDVMARD